MASSNRGLIIGCVALTVVTGGCITTIGVGAAAFFVFARSEASAPIAFPMPTASPAPVPPIAVAPPVPPIGVAPVPEVVPIAPPTPTPPPVPEPAGVMRLTSVPDGARVSEGGIALGVTPLEVPVAARGASRTVHVEADGYLGSDVTIYDTPGSQQVTLQAARVERPAETGSRTASAETASSSRSSGSSSSGSRTGSTSSGSSSSGSRTSSTSSSGSTSGTTHSGSAERPVATTVRPGGSTSGTTTSGSSGTGSRTGSTRSGSLSHDDF